MLIFPVTTHLLISVISSSALSFAARSVRHDQNSWPSSLIEIRASAYPCPENATISPCTCTYTEPLLKMYMDCSKVNDEDELRIILNQDFEVKDFYQLYVDKRDNPSSNIIALTNGVFGENTFKLIHFHYTDVASIDKTVFYGMENKLEWIKFYSNQLTRFEADFSNFSQINQIELNDNQNLSEVVINSPTLHNLQAFSNQLASGKCSLNLPTASSIHLKQNSLTYIIDISASTILQSVDLELNELTKLKRGDLCQSKQFNHIYLAYNRISLVEENSICIKVSEEPDTPFSHLDMRYNQIATLEESVWGEVLRNLSDYDGYNHGLRLDYNPLICGCDVAWIYEQELLDKISDNTQCENGTNLQSLNANVLANCP